MLFAKQIAKAYGNQQFIQSLDLQIGAQEKLAIIGETGSGKTTLLRLIAGLLDLDHGEISLDGQRVEGPSEVLIPGHPSISYLNQAVHLRNHYTVEDLIERHSVLERSEDWDLARLCRVDHLLKRKTDQLSGGERQRIALAIELSKKPRLLLLDEPFSNLDIGHRNTLRVVLNDLHQKGLTLVIVSHNPTEILGWADRMLVMRQGKCIQDGSPHEIYHSPLDEYVAQLLGPYNLLPTGNSDEHQIVRPELLQIVSAGTASRRGVILEEEYEGHSSLYKIQSQKLILYVRDQPGLGVGAEVGIFIKTNQSI